MTGNPHSRPRRTFTRLLPLLLIALAALVLTSVAHAQATTPTVSLVAITSSPGTDNTYATGDTITASVTFSETVTVTGTPYVVLDIGGQPRNFKYSGDGSSAATQLFSYTVLVGDMDTDGVSLLVNSLTLNGGTIQATDDSTNATLTHAAMTFANHKVDTEITLLSSLGQPDASDTITVSATESASFTLDVAEYEQFDINAITLDVKTPSQTLDVTVRLFDLSSADYTYTGSVTAAGLQRFTLSGPSVVSFGNVGDTGSGSGLTYDIEIHGSGAGSVELAGTTSVASDPGAVSGISFVRQNVLPQMRLSGHEGAVPALIYGDVISSPLDGTAYAAGDRIDMLLLFTRPVDVPQGLTLPFWLGNSAEHRREASLIGDSEDLHKYLHFAYTVQPGDADTDGIYIGANPLGDNAGIDFHAKDTPAVPARLQLAANQVAASQSVDGSGSRICQEVLCSTLLVGENIHEGGSEKTLGYSTTFYAKQLPFVPLGASSAVSFEHGGEVYAVARLYFLDQQIPALDLAVIGELPRSLYARLALSVDETVFLLSEADHIDSGYNFVWFDDPGLPWPKGDEIDVKLIETATATFDAATYAKAEGDSFDVTVTLGDSFLNTLTLPIVVAGNGGADAADYSGIPESLVFAPGDTEKTFTVTIEDDNIDDYGESLTLSFGEESHIRSGGANETATITITQTLVSNTAQGSDSDASYTSDHGQAFTTGYNLTGYTVTGVTIISEDAQGDDIDLQVCEVDGNGLPTTACTDLTAPASFAAGPLTFNAPTGSTLTAGTTYMVVFKTPGGDQVQVDATTSDDEDSSSLPDWSIRDLFQWKNNQNVWQDGGRGRSIRITIQGTVNPPYATAPTAMDSTVSATEDTAYIFTAADFNFSATTVRDTLASVRILTLPAEGTLALTGAAVTVNQLVTKAQLDAGNLVYTPPADANGTGYTSFLFRVSGSSEASTSAYSMTIDVSAVNDPATGTPAISGIALVGQTLTASTGGIADADGLPSAFTYQWKRYAANGTTFEANIGADSNRYTLTASEEGKKVLVEASFTDNGGGSEGPLVSPAYPASGTVGAAPLVSNTGQGGDQSATYTSDHGQAFTTGDNLPGYNITGVTIISEDPNNDDIALQICEVDRDGNPTTTCTDLTAPNSFARGPLVFSVPAGSTLTLAAETTYMVVFKAPGAGAVRVDATSSDDEDSTSLPDWSIRDLFQWNNAGSWQDSSRGRAIRIAISGTVNETFIHENVTFVPDTFTREVNENTGANQNVGSPVTATYTGTCTLTYALGGADDDSFEIDSSTGQIKTKSGVTYDHEAKSTYTVTVTASDANCGTATATVTINVNDVNEPPRVPLEVVAHPVPRSYDQLFVRWTPPGNAGRPDITGYDIQYDFGDSGNWRNGPQNVDGTSGIVSRLQHGAYYEVRVRAKNDEGSSPWSEPYFVITNVLDYEVEVSSTFVPDGLVPGDSFHLLFVTSPVQALRTKVQGYSDTASSAVLNLPRSNDLLVFWQFFRPVVSARHIDARVTTNTTYTNEDKGTPIYWVGGGKAADDYEDFYDGDWDDESATNARGEPVPLPDGVWTGSTADGRELIDGGTSRVLGESMAGYGAPGSTTTGEGPIYSGSTAANTERKPIVSLSSVFRVVNPPLATNKGQIRDTDDRRSAMRSQAFTTGSNRHGYELSGVALGKFYEGDTRIEASIYSVDANGHPDTLLFAFTNLDSYTDDTQAFNAPAGATLDPGTTYAVVVQHANSGADLNLYTTASDNEDDESLDDWSIADAFHYGSGGSWQAETDGKALQIIVRGTAKAGASLAPTGLTASAVGRDRIDLSWTAPTDDGGSAITGYRIESSANGSAGWADLVADTGSAATTHSHTGLMPNTTLHYRVSAINGEGTSDPSGTANATTADNPAVTVSFEQAAYTVAEGGTVTVTVTLNADPERTVVIPIVATPQGGASSADDYSGVPSSVTFSSGQTYTSFPFMAAQDDVNDDGESVLLAFGMLPSRVSAGTTATTTVSITDVQALVSNTGQGGDQSTTYTSDHGQAFTTGDNLPGYNITGVTIISEDPNNDDIALQICEVDRDGNPTTTCTDLTAPNSFARGPLVFSVPAGSTLTLAAGTTYMVVFKAPGAEEVRVDATSSDDEDSTSLPDWSIRDLFQWNNAGSWQDSSGDRAIRIAISGTVNETFIHDNVTFVPDTFTREVNENSGANQNVGSPVTATYPGTCTLTYALGGTDAASFEIDSSTGQIKTKSGVTYDHEAKSTYTVTVTASDANCGTATATVTINVNDVNEPPRVPLEVVAYAVPRIYDQLFARWTPPGNAGRPDITGYDIQYGQGSPFFGISWRDGPQNVDGTSATISGPRPYSHYYVRVRAKNDEGSGPWSEPYSTTTNILDFEVETSLPFIPDGLVPGDRFHLLFVTPPAQALETILDDYFNLAASPVIILPETNPFQLYWKFFNAVASIRHIDARVITNTTYTNEDKGAPIYWVGGGKAADDYEDFYDGDWDDESARNVRGELVPLPDGVWTGSTADGRELIDGGTSRALGQSMAGYGAPGSTTTGEGPFYSGSTAANTEWKPIFSLSSVFRIVNPPLATNEGQMSDTDDRRSAMRSQAFTTGSNRHGYELSGVALGKSYRETTRIELSIYSVDANGHPDTLLFAFTNLDSYTNHTQAYNAPAGATLDPGTTYAVVVQPAASGDDLNLYTTASDNEDDESLDDWSIADAFHYGSGGSWQAETDGKALQIIVRGTAKAGASLAPTGLTASAVGRDRIDLSWTAPMDDGGSAITGYRIESSADGSAGWADLVADTGSAATTHSHTGLMPNTTLHYRVSAINGEGTSDPSGAANATTADNPAVTVSFEQAAYTVAEGGTVTVTVTLNADPERTVVIPITATPQGTTTTDDYSVAPTSVTFDAGDMSKTITFTATQDTDDDDESVKLTFGMLPSRVSAGTTAETTVSITDDDNPPTASDGTVTAVEDTAHTFAAASFSYSDTDNDPLVSVKIIELPAAGALTLNGTAIASADLPKTVTATELTSGGLKYAPPANANGTGYASFKFKVNDGTEDSASEYFMTINLAAVNDPATGTPTISGTAQVGQILTASTAGIADVDGVPSAFTYQWKRYAADRTTFEANIGTNSSTYTLTASEEGKKVLVEVRFTDNGGSSEGPLVSALYPSTQSQTVDPNTPPTASDGTVTATEDTAHTFTAASFSYSDTDNDPLVSVKIIELPATGALTLNGTVIASADLPKTVTATELTENKLTYSPPTNANGTGYASFKFKVNDGTADSASEYFMTINVTAVNDPATGTPTISGTAQVGQILTASTAGIADVDGVPSAFTYQWKRYAADRTTFEANIGTNSSTYTLTASEEGKKVLVEVRFTDNGGSSEGPLSSALYPSTQSQTVDPNTPPTASDGTVTATEDTAHTFRAASFSYSDTDNDPLVSVKIIELPAAGALTLNGTAIPSADLPKTVTATELTENKLTYAPPANANGTGYASFKFKVNDGTEDSASEYFMTINVTAVNDPATGTPTISGTAQVGQILTASTAGIADVDGVPSAFTYQWIRVDADGTSNPTNIGTDLNTYTLTASEEGKKIKVEVRFTDNGGSSEGPLVSALYPSTQSQTVDPNNPPTASDGTVTATEDTAHTFRAASFSYSDTDNDPLVSVKIIELPAAGALTLNGTAITSTDLPKTVTAAELTENKLTYSPPTNANGTGYASFKFKVNDGTEDSASEYFMTINLAAVNDPATGRPTISGTAQVGQILTASTAGIADVDGVPSAFTYQWIRVDADGTSNPTNIGTDLNTYTLTASEEGKKIKVEVRFTDNGGSSEGPLVSALYPSTQSQTVDPNTPPTASDGTVIATEDTAHTFTAASFSYSDTDNDPLVSVKIIELPAAGALTLNGTAIASTDLPKTVTATELTENKLTYAPPANANGTGYASFKFKVNDGTADSASEYFMTINVTAVNDPATGTPTISGTAQVGQILTASTAGIADVDGVPSAFTYQWKRYAADRITFEANIGTNSSTYTLTESEVGKKIKVEVRFTDNGGSSEGPLSSALYPSTQSQTVDPNNPPTASDGTVTATEDTAHTFTAASFSYSDTDNDPLVSVKIIELPATGALTLNGTAITSADLPKTVTAAELTENKLTYSPPTNANGTGYASFKFKLNDGTEDSASEYFMTINLAAVNDPATGTPTISGTAQVGQIMTAWTGDIADPDGVPNSFTYQWKRVDADGTSNPTNIGTDLNTYTLTESEVGKKILVEVRFTDNGGSSEGPLSSAAYPSSGTVVNLTVSFGETTYMVTENGTVSVIVHLSADPERTVVIPLTATPQDGAALADYSVPSTVTFNAGDMSQTFTFTATQDEVDDDGESVLLGFGAPLPGGVNLGTTTQATVSITDDDGAGVSVSESSLTIAEGSSGTYTIELDSQPTADVTVTINDPSNTDVTAEPASLTFSSTDWNTPKTVTVSAAQDADAEDETATVTHTVTSTDSSYSGASANSVAVSVTDDEVLVTVSFGATTYEVVEGETVMVAVTLSADPERTVVIPMTHTPQSGADSPADYSGVPANLTFNTGQMSQTITFEAIQDEVDDDGESVLLGFGAPLPGGVNLGTTTQATVSITDDDGAGVSVSESSLTIAEGSSGTYTIELDSQPIASVTVTINDPSNTDVTAEPASLTFSSTDWNTPKTVTVSAAQDADAEDETATVTHTVTSTDSSYSGASANSVAVSVTDDEVLVTVSFGATTYEVVEGETVMVAVTLSADPERTVVIPMTHTPQSGADSPADYSGVPANLTFNTGQMSQTITFEAIQDEVDDDGESVLLGFGAPLPGGVNLGTTTQATVSITDDDGAGVSVSESSLTIAEGSSGTYTIELDSQPIASVTVTINDPSNTDVTAEPASLTFSSTDWNTPKTVTVSAAQDADAEDETATVTHTVTSTDSSYSGASANSVAVSVTDDEVLVTVSFGATTYEVVEGETVMVAVTLSADPERTVVIPITHTPQSGATSPADYTVPANLTFNTGDMSQTFTFTATQDDVDDDGESVLLGFGAPLPGGVSLGTTTQATVSITDDDGAGVSVSESSLTIAEGSSGTYTIELDSQPTASVAVAINDPSNTDVTAEPASLTFSSTDWNTPKTVTVSAAQDADAEDETATVTHTVTSTDSSYSGASANSVAVSVTDDEVLVTVSFGATTYEVVEGETVMVAVTLSADPERTVVIPLVATEEGGASSEDYSGVPSSVTINAGETAKTFEFMAMADDASDTGESVMIGFGTSLPSRVTEGTPNEARVTIKQVSTQFSLDCSLTATVWCADLGFSDRVAENYGWLYMRYGHGWDPPSSLSDDDFRFRGVDYDVRNMELRPGTHPVMPNAWSRWQQGYSSFRIGIYWDYRWGAPSEEHYRDWVLHLDGLELPFKDALRHGGDFVWVGEEFQQVFNDWTPSTVTKIGIKEVAAADQDTNPLLPRAPMQVDAWPEGPDRLLIVWAKPAWFYPGLPDPTSYIVQWKLASADWSDSAAVSQLEVAATSNFQAVIVNGMTEDAVYSVRVIASNDAGDGPPSEETLGRPQDSLPRLIARTVNGQTLTLRFSEQLDPNAVPAGTAFTVLADGGLIEVDSVAIRGNEVVLTLDRAVTAATHSVKVRYDKPTDPSAVFLQDTNGNYANIRQHHELLAVVNITPQLSVQPLTAQFTNMPSSHDGRTRFTFDIEFSEPVWIGDGLARDDMLEITGGTVVSAPWKDRRTDKFIVHVRPDTQGDIVIVLPGHRACHGIVGSYREVPDPVAGAPCAVGSRVLTNEPTVTIPGPSSPAQQVVENTPAEGEPQINGIPEVGQTLSADTTDIEDADSLENVVFQYQWLAEDAAIAGATGPTYTLTSGDVGKAITVRVAFTDDGGNDEELTSAPTTVVTAAGLQLQSAIVDGATLTLTYNEVLDTGVSLPQAAFAVNVNGSARSLIGVGVGESNVLIFLSSAVEARDTVTVDYTAPDGDDFIRDIRGRKAVSFSGQAVTNDRDPDPLTASAHAVPSSHNGQDAFSFELRFSEAPTPDFSYRTVWDHAFTVTGGSVTYVRRLEPGKNVRWEITVTPSTSDAVAIALNATTDCSAQGAICTEDGGKLSGGLLLAVPGPNTPATDAPNTPATGAPTITGTARVGETLTASTTGISDNDGLDNVTFAYQWLADDAEINGATASSYTLVAADAGKAITVRVSFTDDAGNDEELTSAVTGAVAATVGSPPNTPATGAPTITGTARVGETLTAATTGISDDDSLDNAVFAYQWLADDAEINGATASSYTLVAADAGKAITVRVSFTDDAGNDEELTSAVTGAVAAVVNPPLTASAHAVPSSHNGQDAFIFELRFSEAPTPDFSYRTVWDHAFTVTGGSVTYVRRLEPGKNVRWEITVTPGSSADVAIALNATTDCEADGAICTEDGRMLSRRLELTVNGPE